MLIALCVYPPVSLTLFVDLLAVVALGFVKFEEKCIFDSLKNTVFISTIILTFLMYKFNKRQ